MDGLWFSATFYFDGDWYRMESDITLPTGIYGHIDWRCDSVNLGDEFVIGQTPKIDGHIKNLRINGKPIKLKEEWR